MFNRPISLSFFVCPLVNWSLRNRVNTELHFDQECQRTYAKKSVDCCSLLWLNIITVNLKRNGNSIHSRWVKSGWGPKDRPFFLKEHTHPLLSLLSAVCLLINSTSVKPAVFQCSEKNRNQIFSFTNILFTYPPTHSHISINK